MLSSLCYVGNDIDVMTGARYSVEAVWDMARMGGTGGLSPIQTPNPQRGVLQSCLSQWATVCIDLRYVAAGFFGKSLIVGFINPKGEEL